MENEQPGWPPQASPVLTSGPDGIDIKGRPLRSALWAVFFAGFVALVGTAALGLYGADRIHNSTDRFFVAGGAILFAILAATSFRRALLLRGVVVSVDSSGFRDTRISTQMIPWSAVKDVETFRGGLVIVFTDEFAKRSDLERGAWNNVASLTYLVRRALPLGGYVVSARGLKISAKRLTETMMSHRDAAVHDMTLDQRRAIVPTREDPTAAVLLGLKGRQPVLSFALLAVLVLIFVAELLLAQGDGTAGRYPGDLTPLSLVLDGGLTKGLVTGGQIWRFFTAPLLHVDPLHLLGNGIALIFAGYLLERLIGWRWYGAIFAISALTGGMASYACDPSSLVSAGASGGIVGLFAAAVVIAFHFPSGALRKSMIIGALRILVPTLLPRASHASGGPNIDVAAHIGGAFGGLMLGFVIWALWADQRELKKSIVPAAVTISFALSATVAFGFAASYRATFLALDRQLPQDFKQRMAQSVELIKAYPRDPRIRYARAAALYNSDHDQDAKAMLTDLLSDRTMMEYFPGTEVSARKLLSQIDDDAGNVGAAKADLKPLCDSNRLSANDRAGLCK